ncbi:MAG: circadian clock protein KaiC [Thermoanaerobaculia bacterium]|nr:circadian clock protein KaiC [Thermoanaerobaculia bacterium]
MSSTIDRLETGIEGFDAIGHGGLPEGRVTLVAGSAGAGKTIFGAQFLAAGIERGEPGVFVTCEESPADLRANLAGLGWDLKQWEADDEWAFVDASPRPAEPLTVAGEFDLEALTARIRHAVERIGARRLALDTLGSLFAEIPRPQVVRRSLQRIGALLREMGVTVVVTGERPHGERGISRHDVEEFVADNVVVLRFRQEEEKRWRTVEILKLRGGSHHKGEVSFTILPGRGIQVIPLSSIRLTHQAPTGRISSGVAELDRMTGGGLFRGSTVLLSGATGTGKTLASIQFLHGNVETGERGLLLAYEESRRQLVRNAASWGMDLEAREAEDRLRILSVYPETRSLEDHLIRVREEVEEMEPTVLALDSLSALERVSTEKSYREFVVALTAFLKERKITSFLTSTTTELFGGASITEGNVSTIADAIILMRYVEVYGELRRGLAVLKMRGSKHDKRIREVVIDDTGMHVGSPFRAVTGIMGGRVVDVSTAERDRLQDLADTDERADG